MAQLNNTARNVDLKSVESVQDYLSQSVLAMAEGTGTTAKDRKTINEYLEHIQRPGFSAADLVKETEKFLKSDFAVRVEKDFRAHGDAGAEGGSYKGLLDDMTTATKAFADEWGVKETAPSVQPGATAKNSPDAPRQTGPVATAPAGGDKGWSPDKSMVQVENSDLITRWNVRPAGPAS